MRGTGVKHNVNHKRTNKTHLGGNGGQGRLGTSTENRTLPTGCQSSDNLVTGNNNHLNSSSNSRGNSKSNCNGDKYDNDGGPDYPGKEQHILILSLPLTRNCGPDYKGQRRASTVKNQGPVRVKMSRIPEKSAPTLPGCSDNVKNEKGEGWFGHDCSTDEDEPDDPTLEDLGGIIVDWGQSFDKDVNKPQRKGQLVLRKLVKEPSPAERSQFEKDVHLNPYLVQP